MIEISSKDSKKIKVLTFLCAILVVPIHTYNVEQYSISFKGTGMEKFIYIIENFISDGVARTAVPLFFILSSFLFFYKITPSIEWFIKKYKKRFKSLLIPYLIWNIVGYMIFLIPFFIKQLRPFMSGYIQQPTVIDFIQGVFLYKYNYAFWFMFNLIILVIISPAIYTVLKNKQRGQIITIIILIGWILEIKIENLIIT